MKKLILLFLILTITSAAFCDDPFCPVTKGMVQLTANLNGSGRVEGYSLMTIKDVRGSGSNITVIYTVQILDRNKRPVRNAAEREYTINITNGVSMYRLDDIMDAFFTTRGFNYTLTAGNMNVPSNLAPGSRLANTWVKAVIKIPIVGTVTAETTITNLVCTGIETVTVPAGTFEAYKVTQSSTTATTGWPTPQMAYTGATWYVRGVGVVKSVSYDDRGRIESSTELYELR